MFTKFEELATELIGYNNISPAFNNETALSFFVKELGGKTDDIYTDSFGE